MRTIECRAQNVALAVISAALTVACGGNAIPAPYTAPVITQGPSSVTVREGDAAQFAVVTDPYYNITGFEWSFGGKYYKTTSSPSLSIVVTMGDDGKKVSVIALMGNQPVYLSSEAVLHVVPR